MELVIKLSLPPGVAPPPIVDCRPALYIELRRAEGGGAEEEGGSIDFRLENLLAEEEEKPGLPPMPARSPPEEERGRPVRPGAMERRGLPAIEGRPASEGLRLTVDAGWGIEEP